MIVRQDTLYLYNLHQTKMTQVEWIILPTLFIISIILLMNRSVLPNMNV